MVVEGNIGAALLLITVIYAGAAIFRKRFLDFFMHQITGVTLEDKRIRQYTNNARYRATQAAELLQGLAAWRILRSGGWFSGHRWRPGWGWGRRGAGSGPGPSAGGSPVNGQWIPPSDSPSPAGGSLEAPVIDVEGRVVYEELPTPNRPSAAFDGGPGSRSLAVGGGSARRPDGVPLSPAPAAIFLPGPDEPDGDAPGALPPCGPAPAAPPAGAGQVPSMLPPGGLGQASPPLGAGRGLHPVPPGPDGAPFPPADGEDAPDRYSFPDREEKSQPANRGAAANAPDVDAVPDGGRTPKAAADLPPAAPPGRPELRRTVAPGAARFSGPNAAVVPPGPDAEEIPPSSKVAEEKGEKG